MGVSGLLPCVLPAAGRSFDLSELSARPSKRARPNHETNKIRMGIDVSGWIARICHGQGANLLDERHLSQYGRAGLLACASPNQDQHQQQQQQQDPQFVRQCAEQCVRRILLVREESGADILVVLDGATPPLKAHTCRDRRAHRQDAATVRDAPPSMLHPNKDRSTTMEHDDDEDETARIRAARKAGVNPKQYQAIVALLLQELLPHHSIPFLVAPYEADGQLAYLASRTWLDVICTDDSDFIAHGVSSLLYRLQINHPHHPAETTCTHVVVGTATLLHKDDWGATPATPVSLLDFSTPMVACLFVAAGCDYCASLRGIGIGKARDAVHHAFYGSSSTSTTVLQSLWDGLYQRCFSTVPLSHADKVAYEQVFIRALFLFRHAIVFCPLLGKNVYAHIDTPDTEFMDHAPYASLHSQIISNQNNTPHQNVKDVDVDVESIFGQLHDPDTAVAIAEGRLNPKTNQPYQLPILIHPQGETETNANANANVTVTAREEETTTAAAATTPEASTGTSTPPIQIPARHSRNTTTSSTPVTITDAAAAAAADATTTVLVEEEAVIPPATSTPPLENSMERSTAKIMEDHSFLATQESIPIALPSPALQQSSQGSTTMENDGGSNTTVADDAVAVADGGAVRDLPQEGAVHVPSTASPAPATLIVVDTHMEECSVLATQESIPIAPLPALQQPSQESTVEHDDSETGSNVGVAADTVVAHEAAAARVDITPIVEEHSLLATQESIPIAPPPPALQQSSEESAMIGSNDSEMKMRKDDSSSPPPTTEKGIPQEETAKDDNDDEEDEEAMLDLGTQQSHGFGSPAEGVARTNLEAVLEPPLPQVADDPQPQHELQEL
eukprot:scaffold71614_cov50-Attheya_sp.AAC.1